MSAIERRRIAAFLLATVLVSGCAGSAVETKSPSRISGVTSVQSSEDRNDSTTAPESIRRRFQALLDEALYSENHFQRGRELTIRWRLVGYHEGSRALRYLVGFGAGQGKIVVQAIFLDPRGKEVGAIKAEGSITMGAFGGSYETALSKCADAIAEYATKTFASGVR